MRLQRFLRLRVPTRSIMSRVISARGIAFDPTQPREMRFEYVVQFHMGKET
jgi:hypothetical protein